MAESARDRIVRVAVGLFAERGYGATSVALIQEAAGLAPGSGALYKHFRSKEELLAAAVERHVSGYQEAEREVLPTMAGGDPRQALEAIAYGLVGALEANADLVRVTFRDLRDHPELADRVFDGVLRALHRTLAGWLAEQAAAGRLRVADCDATAAVLFSGLSYYRALAICTERAPAEIDDERLVRAWIELVAHGLVPSETGD
ncbi:TetR/AcrR family transcriptional regulator [Amycolatopsis sp. H20-H5]|uniref:TetR/AcrR family transcriptional regulator n=1 Tax=Amycolatopsis sp. H20-H5 TaxID=3046309 RepID=UPI002DB59E5A|nr:TetR/AcrR family transcriptional regulator [Amycolatopsis sp. H20-H5]MEC3979175.1 TetR/AcrR family transcriptional regulator [Amycolatopsis sp. H20-H5]